MQSREEHDTRLRILLRKDNETEGSLNQFKKINIVVDQVNR